MWRPKGGWRGVEQVGEKEEDVVVMGVCGVGEGDWIKMEVENLEER